MSRSDRSIVVLAAFAAMAIGVPSRALADAVSDFYKGRNLTILVGQEPGTGYDIYARLLARFLPRYVPGAPSLIVQNMPGASGVNAANYLFGVAPKDGTVIGTFTPNVIVEPLLGNPAAKYDAARMAWVGNMEEGASVCGVRTDAGVSGIEQLRDREIVVGATGPTGPLGQAARALNAIVGTRLKIIYGYKGSASVRLAIQKGEVQGVCGLTWSTIKSFWRDDLEAGTFKPVLQTSARPQPDLVAARVAHIDHLLSGEESRQMVDLVFGTMVLGRVYAISADVPRDRADALRRAFIAAMADRELLADAEKARIDIIPATGEEVAATVKRFYAVPAPVVERVRNVIAGN